MKVLCPDCKVINNVDPERTGAKCGKCKTPLVPEAPGYPVEISDAQFDQAVLKSQVPVLLDLWGQSCPPCRQLAPVLKELAKVYAGKLKVAKLNVEQQPQAAERFGIRGIPTLFLFKDGKELARTAGFQPLNRLEMFVRAAL